jgi:hypothetical protein
MKSRVTDKRRFKEGRGKGKGKDYKPWLLITDLSSKGRVHRDPSTLFDRDMHYMSDLEQAVGILCERAKNVIDIREQYPLLPLQQTVDIAKRLQIRHIKGRTPLEVVMTTDFLITMIGDDGKETSIAICVKPGSGLDPNTIKKLQIEKTYWDEKQIRWIIITEAEIDSILLNNVRLIREQHRLDHPMTTKFVQHLKHVNEKATEKIGHVIGQVSKTIKIPTGEGQCIFKHLISQKRVNFNFLRAYSLELTLSEFDLSEL